MGDERLMTSVYVTCAFSAFLFLFLAVKKVTRRTSRLPPGPKGWPIVGSLYSLGPKSVPACRKFTTLAENYGPLVFLRMGSRPTLIVSNYTTARAFFDKDHDKIFDSRPRLATGKHIGYDYSSTVFSSGTQFDRMKKIYKSELLSPSNVRKLEPLRMEEIKLLLGDMWKHPVAARGGSGGRGYRVVDVTAMVFKANLNLMGRIIFSQRLFGEDREKVVDAPPREIENFKFFVKSATKLVGLFNMGDYIPALRWLDLQGVEADLQRLKPHQEGLLLPIIHEYRRRQREGEAQDGQLEDLMATLVHKHSSLTDENIMAVAIDLIVGGSDSVSTAVEWALAELLRHVSHLHEAQSELDSTIGRHRLLELSDCDHLPFLDCIVRETLRLHPPVPLAIPHYSKQDCELSGYRIPKETTAYINIYAIGRDPEVWDNPNEFKPHRFRDSSVKVLGQHFELLPFSAGRRGCPGVHFAIPSFKLLLGNLLQCFDWSPPPGIKAEEIGVDEAIGVVCSRLNPLVASASPRVPEHVVFGHA